MRSLDYLASLSQRGCFFLAADKGPNLIRALQSGHHEDIDKHGAVSVSVNFHALTRWVESRGGRVWQQAHPYSRLNVLAFQLGGEGGNPDACSRVFAEAIADFGPDDFANLKDEMLGQKETISAPSLFSFLRLSNWDPEMVLSFYTRLARLLPAQNPSVRKAFLDGFRQSSHLNYSLNPAIRFDFLLGGLCASLEEYPTALQFYVNSVREEGESADAVYNAALCLARLGATDDCKKWLRRAEALGVSREEVELVLAECD
jgi:tetratricopeptide (TPR) repeat protein